MNLFEIMDTFLRLVFINCIENSFFVVFSLIWLKKELDVKKMLTIIFVASIASQFIYVNEESISVYFAHRLIVFSFISVMILILYNMKIAKFLTILKSIFISFGVIAILEGITVLPFVKFLDLNMELVRSNIFSILILSFPTRVIEFLVLYNYYIKKGVKK